MNVGDTVYVFDENRRVYRRDAQGRAYGSPIYREHFKACTIVAETSRSWILDATAFNKKIPKDTLKGCFTLEQVEQQSWIHDHRYRIVSQIQSLNDYALLKQIASLIAYQEEELR